MSLVIDMDIDTLHENQTNQVIRIKKQTSDISFINLSSTDHVKIKSNFSFSDSSFLLLHFLL